MLNGEEKGTGEGVGKKIIEEGYGRGRLVIRGILNIDR